MASYSGKLGFYHLVENLKKTKRTGWVNNKIPNPESISDHMYRMSIIAFTINDTGLNRDRCIKMALVHDLAESLVGDITPYDKVPKEEKFRMEKEAMDRIKDMLEDKEVGAEIEELWLEYEHGKTAEAQLVKDIDKFEMVVQAYEYEKEHGVKLDSFFHYPVEYFNHPKIKELVAELYKERDILKSRPTSE